MAAKKSAQKPTKKPSSRARSRATNKTSVPDWADMFLSALREQGTILQAARTAGVARCNVYARRDSDPAFARAMCEAIEDATDVLESEARRRAIDGSDALIVQLLKAYRPERFKDRVEYTGQTKVTISAEDMSDEQLAAIAAGR